MREKYESLSLATLKDLAKARGLKGISTLRKPELIERMLQEDEKESTGGEAEMKKTEILQPRHESILETVDRCFTCAHFFCKEQWGRNLRWNVYSGRQ